MTVDARPSLWARIYRSANWILIVLFMLLAAIHVVLTVLFYLGIWDTGVGYVLSYQWPAWLVTITDAAAATSLWLGYRRGADAPWLGLALTLLASAIMLAREMDGVGADLGCRDDCRIDSSNSGFPRPAPQQPVVAAAIDVPCSSGVAPAR